MFALLLTLITSSAQAGEAHAEGVEPDAALQHLVEGNQRFVAGKGTNAGELPADRDKLASGQKPEAMVLTCADSRVPPELIFDQGLGKIFDVRAAGNNVDDHLVASLEYAEEHLGSRLLVVMGHTSCGAVKAAVTTPAGTSAGSPALDELVHDIQLCMGPLTPEQAKDPVLREAVWANVHGVEKELLKSSTILQHAVEGGHVELVGAVYDLSTGNVTFEKPYHAVAGAH